MLHLALKTHFHFTDFRPGQQEIVEAILAGHDVVALMPTGGGKSLCYQLPAVVGDTVTIVISPLIALMKDQVDALRARGIAAGFLNSSLSPAEMGERLQEIGSGKFKLLYIAPERFASPQFRALLQSLPVGFIAVDEAHCVSSWGHDFRPDYLRIAEHIRALPHRPVVAAFTATATPEVKDDIISRLALVNPKVFIRGFDRPNLRFFVHDFLPPRERLPEAMRIMATLPGSGVLYCLSRKDTEKTAQILCENGISAIAYHAGMAPKERSRIQNEFMENKYRVIVATIAFGMGVDKADIRFVLHLGMPASMEGYYQEAGRAGRDGELAYCILMPSKKDLGAQYFFINSSREEMTRRGKAPQEIEHIIRMKYDRLHIMESYVKNRDCRRRQILQYFSDPAALSYGEQCRGCDVCLNHQWDKRDTEKPQRHERRINTSDTVQETVRLYEEGHTPEQIASMRSLGVSTIMGHLIDWYRDGGALDKKKFITPDEERQILSAMSQAEDYTRLGAIKQQLPETMSYEKIRWVLATIQRVRER